MSYLIDTNVLSELRRKNPNPGVVSWFTQRPAATLYLSVLTLGEIRKGIEGLGDDERRMALLDWLETDLPAFFTGRILPVDAQVADRWGRLIAAAGRPLPAIDSLLAATALAHDLVLVTRNSRDFSGLPLQLINPWTE
ncbi:MAG: type II toxin-antitoxin system VapC family toxin [Sulfurimicrobium sp.]|nr:type II toxin-antitoxin system VapC family toxin [Sulfurimicrobium sp.]